MSRQRDREEFVSTMAREAPDVPLHVVQALMRAETTLHRLAEAQCSDEAYDRDRITCPERWNPRPREGKAGRATFCLCEHWKPQDGATGEGCGCIDPLNPDKHHKVRRGDVREARLQHRLTRMVEPYGIGLHFNGDPRGPAILVGVPSGYTNDLGKRGICVP